MSINNFYGKSSNLKKSNLENNLKKIKTKLDDQNTDTESLSNVLSLKKNVMQEDKSNLIELENLNFNETDVTRDMAKTSMSDTFIKLSNSF